MKRINSLSWQILLFVTFAFCFTGCDLERAEKTYNQPADETQNSNPDVEKNEAVATLSGDVAGEIVAEDKPTIRKEAGSQVLTIEWKDGDEKRIAINLIAQNQNNEPGNFEVISGTPENSQRKIGSVLVFYNGNTLEGKSGQIILTAWNEGRIAGNLQDIQLSKAGGDQSTTSLTGSFNVSLPELDGSDNQFILEGAVNATIEAEDQPTYSESAIDPENAEIIFEDKDLNDVNIRIAPSDASGRLNIANTIYDNGLDQFADVAVYYNGNSWREPTGDGAVIVEKNTSYRITGEVKNVKLENDEGRQITVNGKFNLPK